jgi:hypothetical protein
MKALAKSKEIAVKAKGFADGYEAYAKKRAEAQFLTHAFKDVWTEGDDKTDLDNLIKAIADADKLVKPPKRDYAGATTKVEDVSINLKDTVTTWYDTNLTTKIDDLKAHSTSAFLAKQITEIEAKFKTLKSYIAAQDWRKVLMQGLEVKRMVRGATEALDRRKAFDTQRKKTVAAIDKLKPFGALLTQMNGLSKRLKEADDQASIKNRQFENGVEALKKIESDANALATNGPASETYSTDRPVVHKAFEDLAKHKQAAAQKPLLDAINTKLTKADELASWHTKLAAANAELQLAKHQIDAATKVLGEVDAVNTAAGNAADATTAKKSLDALTASLDAAKKHKHAADFTKEFKALDDKVASAETLLKDANTVPDAINEIKTIGDELSRVMIQLTQQDGYAGERAALEVRLKNVKALPEAKAIQASITPIEVALKDADAQDKAHAFDKRAKAMEKARAAADLAEKTAAQSKEFNARQKTLETNLTGSALSTAEKKQVTDALKLATAQATALNYVDAMKLVVKAEATYESLLINGYAKKSPLDATKIESAAKRMMDSGNAKEIDKLIQKLPDSTPHSVLASLAKVRFGIVLKDVTGEGTATKSAKRILLMLAKVPDDVRNNPSLKSVERLNPDEDGGWYEPGTKFVVMKGRPGQEKQGFGKTIAKELPADVDPNCKPKNADSVDYFDFATLHEVGHSVDDNLQFMISRLGDAKFGNWKTYGGNIDPIVDAVAAWTGYNSTPEQKKALSDLIQGNQVTWPTAPAGKEDEWKKAKKKVEGWYKLAAREGIWGKESDTNKIKIKVGGTDTVFHQAYPRQWVSYDYAARKKGMTGYQFRAPGEWFAELYACYRLDKLQSSHPAVEWLKKLKV